MFTQEQIDFFRKDLESGMKYSKIINTVQKMFKEQGRDFDKEFEEWKKNKENK